MRILFISEYLPQEMLGVMWVSRALKDAGHEVIGLFMRTGDHAQDPARRAHSRNRAGDRGGISRPRETHLGHGIRGSS